MKKILFFFVIILYGCKDNYYSRIRSYIDTIKIVDTHEHQLPPGDSANFYFFNTAYFQNDLHNAGATDFDNPVNGKFNIDSFWGKVGKYYNYSRATSYHAQLMNNLRILYGFNKPYLVKSDIPDLYNRMVSNQYKNYGQWFDEIYHKTNFQTMLQDQHWNRFNTHIDTNYFQLVCNVHECISLVTEAAENKKIVSCKSLLKFMNQEILIIKDLGAYIHLIDAGLYALKIPLPITEPWILKMLILLLPAGFSINQFR